MITDSLRFEEELIADFLEAEAKFYILITVWKFFAELMTAEGGRTQGGIAGIEIPETHFLPVHDTIVGELKIRFAEPSHEGRNRQIVGPSHRPDDHRFFRSMFFVNR